MPRRNFEVVGLHHHLTDDQIEELDERSPLKAEIVREPKNEYDENALKVVISKDKKFRGVHIGYLRRQAAAELSPEIDRGVIRFHDVIVTDFDLKAGTASASLRVVHL